MKSTLRLLVSTLIFGISLQALPEAQDTFEDLIIRFEQSECGKDEESIIFNAFQGGYYQNLYSINQTANYESGDLLCIRAFGYIKTLNTADTQTALFKKILLGLAVIYKEAQNNGLYVDLLCVDPAWQKQGVGKILIKSIEKHFDPSAIRLVALDTAINFYKKIGFECEEGYYNCMIKKC